MKILENFEASLQRPRWLQFQPNKPPIFLKTRSSRWFITTTIAVAVFTDIFLYAVIVPVVPFALHSRAHVHQDRVQYWVAILVAVYGAACLVASPFCGWFADKTTSRRFPLLLGLLALTGATIMLHVGSSVGVLIAGRLLQGVSAAVVWTVGLALMVDTATSQNVAQYMGMALLHLKQKRAVTDKPHRLRKSGNEPRHPRRSFARRCGLQ